MEIVVPLETKEDSQGGRGVLGGKIGERREKTATNRWSGNRVPACNPLVEVRLQSLRDSNAPVANPFCEARTACVYSLIEKHLQLAEFR